MGCIFCFFAKFNPETKFKIRCVGAVVSVILWITSGSVWFCDCSDKWDCDQYGFELMCSAYSNDYCVWDDEGECVNAYCECWFGDKQLHDNIKTWSFVLGIPTAGDTLVSAGCFFAGWFNAARQMDNRNQNDYYRL